MICAVDSCSGLGLPEGHMAGYSEAPEIRVSRAEGELRGRASELALACVCSSVPRFAYRISSAQVRFCSGAPRPKRRGPL